MKKKIIYILIVLFHFSFSYADLIRPSMEIEPFKVVSIQLNGLMKNDIPSKDYGIKQTWEFAHPSNKRYTGPLTKFINMINSDAYKMLLNHIDNEIIEVFKSDIKYGFEVKILSKDKNYYKFQWVVERYLDEGPLNNCW